MLVVLVLVLVHSEGFGATNASDPEARRTNNRAKVPFVNVMVIKSAARNMRIFIENYVQTMHKLEEDKILSLGVSCCELSCEF